MKIQLLVLLSPFLFFCLAHAGPDRVVVGSHLEVGEQESFEEVIVIGGTADVHGQISELKVIGGKVTLHPTSVIQQELVLIGATVQLEPGARIEGDFTEVATPLNEASWDLLMDKLRQSEWGSWWSSAWGTFSKIILKIVALMLVAIVGYILAPIYLDKIMHFLVQSGGKSLVWGILSALVVVPLTVLLLISLIGIPLLPLQFSLLFLFFLFGQIQVAHWMSQKLLQNWSPAGKGIYPKILLGLILLEALSFVPLLGVTIKWLLLLMGFGAASKAFYGSLRRTSF